RHGLPRLAAVRRLEHSGRKLIAAVAEQKAVLAIDEADAVQAGHGIVQKAVPRESAVAREEHDADAAARVGQLFATDHPAEIRIDEVQIAQRSARAGRLSLPFLAAVDGVP